MRLAEVITEIKLAAEKHALIQTIVYDEAIMQELENSGSIKYPCFLVDIKSFNLGISVTNQSSLFYLDLICLDRETQGEENRVYALNDTHAIIIDVLSELFRNGVFSYGINGQATPITEAAPTHTAGWLFPISVTGAFDENTCNIPT